MYLNTRRQNQNGKKSQIKIRKLITALRFKSTPPQCFEKTRKHMIVAYSVSMDTMSMTLLTNKLPYIRFRPRHLPLLYEPRKICCVLSKPTLKKKTVILFHSLK